jgi:hypothetical protein
MRPRARDPLTSGIFLSPAVRMIEEGLVAVPNLKELFKALLQCDLQMTAIFGWCA